MKKRSKRRKKHGFFKSIFISIVALALISGLIVAIPNGYIILSTMNDIKLNVTTKKINADEAKLKEIKKQKPEIAMVLGAGIINNNRPSKILKDRLNIAASLYKNKIVKKILLTGDGRNKNHDETQVMYDYIIKKRIPPEALQIDPYGISTYESMARAASIYKIKRPVIITQRYHLYRALYLGKCTGMKCVGVSSNQSRASKLYTVFSSRETIARMKDFVTGIRKPAPQFADYR